MLFTTSDPVEVLFVTKSPKFEFVQRLRKMCFEAENIEDQRRLSKFRRDLAESALVGDKRVKRVVIAYTHDHLVIIDMETLTFPNTSF